MSAQTTKLLKRRLQECFFRNSNSPSSFFVALVVSAPTADTQTLGELTQITTGNGYSDGGVALTRDAVGFSVAEATGLITVTISNILFTASGGPIPPSGSNPGFAVVTGAGATPSNREVYAWFSLGTPTAIPSGQTLTASNSRLFLVDG